MRLQRFRRLRRLRLFTVFLRSQVRRTRRLPLLVEVMCGRLREGKWAVVTPGPWITMGNCCVEGKGEMVREALLAQKPRVFGSTRVFGARE